VIAAGHTLQMGFVDSGALLVKRYANIHATLIVIQG